MSENFDDVLKRHTKFAEESRVRINKLIAERDPTRPYRYGEKKAKLCNDIGLVDYRINNLKDELEQLYSKRAGLVGQVERLEKERQNAKSNS